VDKIDQFAAELGNPGTRVSEQLLALKFLLHFVGDLHQPLHAADDHDAAANKKLTTARQCLWTAAGTQRREHVFASPGVRGADGQGCRAAA
jgi:hypothetical protein